MSETLHLISWNVAGLRAVMRKKELPRLLHERQPDLLMLQETKVTASQLSGFTGRHPDYWQSYHAAEKKGYSGVSIWARKTTFPEKPVFKTEIDGMPDDEGRFIQMDYGQASFIGCYFPNGGKSEEAWQGKLKFYDHFLEHVNNLRSQKRQVIWCGDLNVAHDEIDLARPKENKNTIGFLPEERAWLDRVIEAGWVDLFRQKHPDKVSYTFWDMVTRARERNVGWRIDYFFVDKSLADSVVDSDHLNDVQGSDHCPVVLDIRSFL